MAMRMRMYEEGDERRYDEIWWIVMSILWQKNRKKRVVCWKKNFLFPLLFFFLFLFYTMIRFLFNIAFFVRIVCFWLTSDPPAWKIRRLLFFLLDWVRETRSFTRNWTTHSKFQTEQRISQNWKNTNYYYVVRRNVNESPTYCIIHTACFSIIMSA